MIMIMRYNDITLLSLGLSLSFSPSLFLSFFHYLFPSEFICPGVYESSYDDDNEAKKQKQKNDLAFSTCGF